MDDNHSPPLTATSAKFYRPAAATVCACPASVWAFGTNFGAGSDPATARKAMVHQALDLGITHPDPPATTGRPPDLPTDLRHAAQEEPGSSIGTSSSSPARRAT